MKCVVFPGDKSRFYSTSEDQPTEAQILAEENDSSAKIRRLLKENAQKFNFSSAQVSNLLAVSQPNKRVFSFSPPTTVSDGTANDINISEKGHRPQIAASLSTQRMFPNLIVKKPVTSGQKTVKEEKSNPNIFSSIENHISMTVISYNKSITNIFNSNGNLCIKNAISINSAYNNSGDDGKEVSRENVNDINKDNNLKQSNAVQKIELVRKKLAPLKRNYVTNRTHYLPPLIK